MLFCVEPGRLEAQARLLTASIRQFGGSFANCPLFAFQPRGSEPLDAETIEAFATHDVRHIAAKLNVDHQGTPTTNKVYAAAALAERVTADTIVFLDTDTVLVNEPTEFALPEDADLAVRPTVRQFRGSRGPGDPADRFWQSLYAACGVPEPPFIRTVADKVRIRAYYNGGLVVMRRGAGVAEAWLERLRRIDRLVGEGRENLDQFALAMVAAGLAGRVRLLPPGYNYPLNRRGELVAPDRRAALADLVHLHYHEAFATEGFLRRVRPALDPGDERFRWLEARLPLRPPAARPWRPAGRLRRRLAARIRLALDRMPAAAGDSVGR